MAKKKVRGTWLLAAAHATRERQFCAAVHEYLKGVRGAVTDEEFLDFFDLFIQRTCGVAQRLDEKFNVAERSKVNWQGNMTFPYLME